MEGDRGDEYLVHIELPEELFAHYAQRAEVAGRTLEAQIYYELEVLHGFRIPDSGDVEATQCGQLFRRQRTHQPLCG